MTDDFLTVEQAEKLTGFVRLSAQRRFLQARGIPHDINGRGELLVLWSVIEAKMGIKRPQEEVAPEPNWDAMYGKKKAS